MKNPKIKIVSWKNPSTGKIEYSAEVGHVILDFGAKTKSEALAIAEKFCARADAKLANLGSRR